MKQNRRHTNARQARADAAYDRFLKILKWVLIVAICYVIVNVSIKIVYNIFRLDGSLPMEGHSVIADEHWLVANHGTTASPSYFKYAEVDTPPGYSRQDSELLSDPNESDFLFVAENAQDQVDQIYVAVATQEYEQAALSARDRILLFYSGCIAQEVTMETMGQHSLYVFDYEYESDGQKTRSLNAYIDTGTRSVLISLTDKGEQDLHACLEDMLSFIHIQR